MVIFRQGKIERLQNGFVRVDTRNSEPRLWEPNGTGGLHLRSGYGTPTREELDLVSAMLDTLPYYTR